MSCTEIGLVRSLLGCSRTSRKSQTYATATVAESSVVTALFVNRERRRVLRKKVGRRLFSPQMPEINQSINPLQTTAVATQPSTRHARHAVGILTEAVLTALCLGLQQVHQLLQRKCVCPCPCHEGIQLCHS